MITISLKDKCGYWWRCYYQVQLPIPQGLRVLPRRQHKKSFKQETNKRRIQYLTQLHVLIVGEHKNNVGSDIFPFLLQSSSEPWRSHSRAQAAQQFCAQDSQHQSTTRILHCIWSNVAKLTKCLSLLLSGGLGSQGREKGRSRTKMKPKPQTRLQKKGYK